jgi:hypothetical protein
MSKLRFLFLALLVLGLVSASLCAATPTPITLPQPGGTFLFNETAIISDFDGDNQPDLATSRLEGSSYKVEIQLSASQETTSFTLSSSERAIALLAVDVDKDNDKDLIIVSATSLKPLALWMNDGHGHFERNDDWAPTNSIASGNPSVSGHDSHRVGQICSNLNNRSPFVKPNRAFLSPKLEADASIRSEAQGPTLRTLTYKFSTRSPPYLFTL